MSASKVEHQFVCSTPQPQGNVVHFVTGPFFPWGSFLLSPTMLAGDDSEHNLGGESGIELTERFVCMRVCA